jgi:putative transposase
MLTPHPLYLALERDAEKRRSAYRSLFRAHLDQTMITDIRLALNQDQPLGDSRFREKIEQMTGVRREARKRGRPSRQAHAGPPTDSPAPTI